MLREHALIGERMLRGLPLLREAAPIVRHEHERFDGDRLPRPPRRRADPARRAHPARVRRVRLDDLAAAVATAALGAPPPHAELRRVAGTQLDPRVVEALLGVLSPPATPPRARPSAAAATAAPLPSTPSA